MTNSIKKEWDALFNSMSKEDLVSSKADLLAMQFLGLVDLKMEKLGVSKKELADKIGTSASFITQLFRGSRKPNWTVLAKMSIALEMEFKILDVKLFPEKLKE